MSTSRRQEVDFVGDEDCVGPGPSFGHLDVLGLPGVEYEEPDLGLLGAPQRTAITLLLDRVSAVAQARSVGEYDRIPYKIDRDFDDIARRAGDRRGYRRLAAGNAIEQARLAGIWRPDDRDMDPVAEPLPAVPVGQVTFDLAQHTLGLAKDAILDRRRQLLVREVDHGFEMSQETGQASAPPAIDVAQVPVELTQRLAALRFGFSRSEVCDRLGLQQVELAVEKGAAGEFAGLGEPQSETGKHLHDRSEHGAAAVEVQFGHVLPGRAARRREPKHHRLVEHVAALRIDEAPPSCDACCRQVAGEQRYRPSRGRPGNAHYRDGSPTGGRCRRKYRIGDRIARQGWGPFVQSNSGGSR